MVYVGGTDVQIHVVGNATKSANADGEAVVGGTLGDGGEVVVGTLVDGREVVGGTLGDGEIVVVD